MYLNEVNKQLLVLMKLQAEVQLLTKCYYSI